MRERERETKHRERGDKKGDRAREREREIVLLSRLERSNEQGSLDAGGRLD